jgi:hypothetical protein
MDMANLTGLCLVGADKVFRLYGVIPRKHIHSQEWLGLSQYRWAGEVKNNKLQDSDQVVTLDTYKYQQKHQQKGTIITHITGSYEYNGTIWPLKTMGVIRNKRLYVVTERSNNRVNDIAPRSPIRLSGLNAAITRFIQETRHSKQQEILFYNQR